MTIGDEGRGVLLPGCLGVILRAEVIVETFLSDCGSNLATYWDEKEWVMNITHLSDTLEKLMFPL